MSAVSELPQTQLKKLSKEIDALIAAAPQKEKRVASAGQRAWFAFMANCRTKVPARFVGCKKAPDFAVVCKEIRKEDEEAYTAFVEKFKAENSATVSEAEVSASSTKVVRLTPEQKEARQAAKSAEKEAAAAAKLAEKEAAAAAKLAEKEAAAAAKLAEKEARQAAKSAEKEARQAAKSAEKDERKAAKLAQKKP